MQIIQPAQQALEIADAIAIGIHIGADRKAIEYRILVPEVIDHAAAARVRSASGVRRPGISGERRGGSLDLMLPSPSALLGAGGKVG